MNGFLCRLLIIHTPFAVPTKQNYKEIELVMNNKMTKFTIIAKQNKKQLQFFSSFNSFAL